MKLGSTLLMLTCATGCQVRTPTHGEPPVTAPARAASLAEHVHSEQTAIVPQVLVVTSSATCAGGRDDDIAQSVADDATLLEEVLLPRVYEENFRVLNAPTPQQLESAIEAADAKRGLWLIYTGHGRVRPTHTRAAGSQPVPVGLGLESLLCLGSRQQSDSPASRSPTASVTPLAVSDLLRWIDQQGFPWANVVLNACESAHLDVSHLVRPISVISASPEPIDASTGSDPLPVATQTPSATRLIQAIAQSIGQGSVVDSNCDGWVSDRELLGAVLNHLANLVILREQNFVMPRLKRQAMLPIPLYGVEQTATCRDAVSNLHAERHLAELLSKQLDPTTELPQQPTDFFFLEDAELHRACLLHVEGRLPAAPGDPQRSQRLETCSLLMNEQLSPFPLAGPTSTPESSTRPLPNDVTRVAKVMRFAELFHVHWEGEWIHIDRLRDGHRMASRPGQLQAVDVPRRRQLLSRWQSGGELIRFTHVVPKDSGTATPREPTVCPEIEGQCFYQLP